MSNEAKENARGSDKVNALVRLIASLNLLVISSFWFGKSESIYPPDSWIGLVLDNIALLVAMASAISIILMVLKPNV